MNHDNEDKLNGQTRITVTEAPIKQPSIEDTTEIFSNCNRSFILFNDGL